MSKYQGIIRIVDVVGTVFERTLTSDEMMAILLGERPVPADTAAPEPTAKRKYKKRGENPAPSKHIKGKARPCCGSMGPRHKKDCPASDNLSSRGNHKVAGRIPFSEGTYYSVKNALDEGQGVNEVVAEKGLDLLEVRRINLADSYEEYLEIA